MLLSNSLVNMEEEAAWAKKMIQQNDKAHIAAFVIPIFILFWTIQAGIKLAADPGNEAKYNQFALLIGVITITFGTVYFIIGLGIVADLALGWSSRFLGKKTAVHQGNSSNTNILDSTCMSRASTLLLPCSSFPKNQAGRETTGMITTTQKDTGHLAATMITMIMLLWAIITGFRLVIESTRGHGRYSGLAISIGVVAIFFGLVYFIIGLAILADLILHFSDELQKNEKDDDIHIDGFIEV